MKVVVQFSRTEELKALAVIYRHSPAVVLPNQTYVLSEGAVAELEKAGVRFNEISRESLLPGPDEVSAGAKI
jgi:hypothetical protein